MPSFQRQYFGCCVPIYRVQNEKWHRYTLAEQMKLYRIGYEQRLKLFGYQLFTFVYVWLVYHKTVDISKHKISCNSRTTCSIFHTHFRKRTNTEKRSKSFTDMKYSFQNVDQLRFIATHRFSSENRTV